MLLVFETTLKHHLLLGQKIKISTIVSATSHKSVGLHQHHSKVVIEKAVTHRVNSKRKNKYLSTNTLGDLGSTSSDTYYMENLGTRFPNK